MMNHTTRRPLADLLNEMSDRMRGECTRIAAHYPIDLSPLTEDLAYRIGALCEEAAKHVSPTVTVDPSCL